MSLPNGLIIWPTDDEDAEITAAALADPDAQPMSAEQLSQLRPYDGLMKNWPNPSDEEVALALVNTADGTVEISSEAIAEARRTIAARANKSV
jgi:hypothetical protein